MSVGRSLSQLTATSFGILPELVYRYESPSTGERFFTNPEDTGRGRTGNKGFGVLPVPSGTLEIPEVPVPGKRTAAGMVSAPPPTPTRTGDCRGWG